jgi:HSP20 family protein
MALPVRHRSQPTRTPDRFDPFSQLEELQSVTQQLMNNMWSGTGDGDGAIWSPPVDIEETDDAWVLEAELPGAEQDDINVDTQGNELTITGEIKEKERQGILRRRSRRVGQFEYRVTLPGDVDADGVDAKLKGGVLTVRVPKPDRARSRHIEIKSE